MAPITMTSLLAPAHVIPSLRAKDFAQLVEEMTHIAARATVLDHPAAQDAVLARAETSSFAFGRGVALPHAMLGGLERPIGVFARLDPSLDLDAPDAIPVDLALLILSPAGDEPTLLRALACGARRLRDRDVAARLRSADGREALHAVLTSDAWRGEVGGLHPPSGHEVENLTNAVKYPTIGASC